MVQKQQQLYDYITNNRKSNGTWQKVKIYDNRKLRKTNKNMLPNYSSTRAPYSLFTKTLSGNQHTV